LYLNKLDWDGDQKADGGALKLYMNTASGDDTGQSASEIRYISPRGGTLIIFDSRYLLHEVEPSNSTRYALTLWICGQRNEMSGKSPPDYALTTDTVTKL
jgi:Rps23 Pro-64 3,4-dihydroxylase Tpa1-like proline 4-hydroxylase